jgi:hypothetical protein
MLFTAGAGPRAPVIDCAGKPECVSGCNVFWRVPENAILGVKSSRGDVQRNSGGGIVPPPLAALIEALFSSVNASPACRRDNKAAFFEDSKAAGKLNFPRSAVNGRQSGTGGAGDGMIRGFFRFIGLLLLAGGFIFLVYDGARSIADQAVRLTKLGEFWNDIHQASQQAVRTKLEASAPWLWDHIVKGILSQPTFAVLAVVGLVLLLLFRPRRPLIGYSRD